MPSFADLKAKAAKTTSAGVEKLQNVKDRNTSVALKKTNWDPYNGTGPAPPPPRKPSANPKTKPAPPLPPPPSRTNAAATSNSSVAASVASRATSASPGPPPPLPSRASSISGPPLPKRPGQPVLSPQSKAATGLVPKPVLTPSGPPPPVARSTKPVLDNRDSFYVEESEPVIDWTNLSPEDKAAFFGWLDEFFSSYLKIDLPSRDVPRSRLSPGNASGPPPLRAATKPASWGTVMAGSIHRSEGKVPFTLSHPPVAIRDSAAADLADFFLPTTVWNEPWYHQSGKPPPLDGNTNSRYVTSWESLGNTKTTRIGVLFSDLSVFWGAVQFAMNDPENERHLKRDASYLSRPIPLDRIKLTGANETYGDTIASFAESFLGTGNYCGRGECWDLASEALKYFNDYDYVPKPVPSISRTHGHLIYEGRATGRGQGGEGRWRGGDDRVRRGDIVEWRRVRIATIGAPPGSYSILGDPDHTAVIVSETTPLVKVSDGSSIRPSDLGTLTVVEQSLGNPPVRKDYNLQGLEEGEMWIYRPISMGVYLGINDLTPTPPSNIATLHTVR